MKTDGLLSIFFTYGSPTALSLANRVGVAADQSINKLLFGKRSKRSKQTYVRINFWSIGSKLTTLHVQLFIQNVRCTFHVDVSCVNNFWSSSRFYTCTAIFALSSPIKNSRFRIILPRRSNWRSNFASASHNLSETAPSICHSTDFSAYPCIINERQIAKL